MSDVQSPIGPITAFASDAYARLAPAAVADRQHGYALLILIAAIGEMFRQVEELVRATDEDHPAGSQILDIERTPDWNVTWLGQWVGVKVTQGRSSAEQRTEVKEEGGFRRGLPRSLIARVAATLTGSKGVHLTERANTAWDMLLTTRPGETPDPAKTKRAALEAKVAALKLVVVQTDFPLIDEGTREIDAAEGELDTATYEEVT